MTLIQGKSAGCWKTTPRSGPGPVIGSPASVTLPPVGRMKPANVCRRVVLPQPEGPTMQTKSPAEKARSIASSACTGPSFEGYSMVSFENSTNEFVIRSRYLALFTSLSPRGPLGEREGGEG